MKLNREAWYLQILSYRSLSVMVLLTDNKIHGMLPIEKLRNLRPLKEDLMKKKIRKTKYMYHNKSEYSEAE